MEHVVHGGGGGLHGGTACAVSVSGLASLAGGDYKWRMQDYGPYGFGPMTGFTEFTVPAACYSLTSTILPAGSGTISAPATTCSGGYTAGTVVQLTAVPNVGYVFGSWSGGASGSSNPVSVTMSGNKSVTANFRASVVLVAPAGTLSSWDSTFSWSGIPTASRYLLNVQKADGTAVWNTWYTAEAAGCTGGTACAVSVSGLASLAGGDYKWRMQDYGPYGFGPMTGFTEFTVPAACYSLTSTILPAGSGTISAPATTCSGGYTAGTVVQLTAVPNVGYVFGSWSGGASGTATRFGDDEREQECDGQLPGERGAGGAGGDAEQLG